MGEVSRCLQGTSALVTTVVHWRPFSYFTVQSTRPPASDATLTPADELTELQVTVSLPDKGLNRRRARQSTDRSLGQSLDRLAAAISAEPLPTTARAP